MKSNIKKRTQQEIKTLFFAADLNPNTPEVDLHGQDIYSAIYTLEDAINETYALNEPVLRIIHGAGTGALKNAVEKHLENHKLIESHEKASYPYSSGVTNAILIK